MKNKAIGLLFAFLLCLFAVPAEARYVQTCKVKYKTKYGWSELITRDVIFVTGYEVHDYLPFADVNWPSVYAIIDWGYGDITLIELSTMLNCGTEVEKKCLANQIADLEGKDTEKREWSICVSEFCY